MNLTVNQFVRIFAGAFVLISLALGVEGSPMFVSCNCLWFTAFVGANLFQNCFTRFCPLENILRKCAAILGALFILDDPIFNGLAISLIFGILVSTLLTLIVIPVLYYAATHRRAAAHNGAQS